MASRDPTDLRLRFLVLQLSLHAAPLNLGSTDEVVGMAGTRLAHENMGWKALGPAGSAGQIK